MITYGSLFSGYGGLDLAAEEVLGATCAWHSEVDPNASKLLAAHWPDVANLGDITAIDWTAVEPVDVIAGGFPCQDISSAGRGAGIKEGTRSGLWYRYCDAVRALRPRLVVVENVGALVVRGLDTVLADLASIGYDAEWTCLRASDIGAPHRRERLFLVAWPAAGDAETWGPGRRLIEGRGDRGYTRPVGGPGGAAADAGGPRLRQHAGGPPPQEAGPGSGDLADDHGRERPHRVGRPAPADSGGHRLLRGAENEERRDALRPDRDQPERRSGRVEWGPYTVAIRRWEQLLGRPAPAPTDERGRLAPAFPEWMMGLPEGWVTDPAHDLSRTQQLKAIGNGVCPQQGAAALRLLLERAPQEAGTAP